MNMAAHQGHLGAMYALAIIHFEGHEHYHSCSLADKLIDSIVKRGNSSLLLSEANDLYHDQEFAQSAMMYLDASFQGHDEAVINAAVLIDKFKIFGVDKTVRRTVEDCRVVKRVLEVSEFGVRDLEEFVFGDVRRIVKDDLEAFGEGAFFGGLGEVYPRDVNFLVSTKLFEIAAKFNINFAFVRLGDNYFYGRHPDGKNYKEAFGKFQFSLTNFSLTIYKNSIFPYKFRNSKIALNKSKIGMYKRATWYNQSIDFKAQGHLSLGFMYQFGHGVTKDLQKARNQYSLVNSLKT
jgi:TPR repeat protein